MRRLLISSGLLLFFFAGGCYYDKNDELHPSPSVCDSAATISYAQHVSPILQSYCVSCHSAGNQQSGIVLDNYTGVLQAAQSGQLYGAIDHLQNFVPMPPNSRLDSCKIRTVQKWVQAGAPNN